MRIEITLASPSPFIDPSRNYAPFDYDVEGDVGLLCADAHECNVANVAAILADANVPLPATGRVLVAGSLYATFRAYLPLPQRIEIPQGLYVGEGDENGEGGYYVSAILDYGKGRLVIECREVGPTFPDPQYVDAKDVCICPYKNDPALRGPIDPFLRSAP